MANWASGNVTIKGTKEGIISFCRRFYISGDEEQDNDDKSLESPERHPNQKNANNFAEEAIAGRFAKSFIMHEGTWADIEQRIKNLEDSNGNFAFSISVDFAWSAENCLIEGYPQSYKNAITLAAACKLDKVAVDIGTTDESSEFREEISCSANGAIEFRSIDCPVFEFICTACGEAQHIDINYGLRDRECESCDAVGKFILPEIQSD